MSIYISPKEEGSPVGNKCIVIFLTEDTAPTYDGKPLMLQNVLFCPVLNWCIRAWMEKGIERFFIVCDSEYHDDVIAACPPGAIAPLERRTPLRATLRNLPATAGSRRSTRRCSPWAA